MKIIKLSFHNYVLYEYANTNIKSKSRHFYRLNHSSFVVWIWVNLFTHLHNSKKTAHSLVNFDEMKDVVVVAISICFAFILVCI